MHPTEITDILISFSVSMHLRNQEAAFQSLMNYLLGPDEKNQDEVNRILKVLEFGSLSPCLSIQSVCVNSILYLLNQDLIYKEKNSKEPSCIIDAVMLLTESESPLIRAKAFQTLSTLAVKSSLQKGILNKVLRDLKMPAELNVSFPSQQNEETIDDALEKAGSYI